DEGQADLDAGLAGADGILGERPREEEGGAQEDDGLPLHGCPLDLWSASSAADELVPRPRPEHEGGHGASDDAFDRHAGPPAAPSTLFLHVCSSSLSSSSPTHSPARKAARMAAANTTTLTVEPCT